MKELFSDLHKIYFDNTITIILCIGVGSIYHHTPILLARIEYNRLYYSDQKEN